MPGELQPKSLASLRRPSAFSEARVELWRMALPQAFAFWQTQQVFAYKKCRNRNLRPDLRRATLGVIRKSKTRGTFNGLRALMARDSA